MMSSAIIKGSLGAMAKQSGKSIAETFLSADAIVIVDTSGSMGASDSRNGRTRYDVACQELASLQNSMPGKIAVLSFSDNTEFCPSGYPTFLGGGTDLTGALKFAKVADVPEMTFIVISDGQPHDEEGVLRIARTYRNKINTIYVGPEEYPSGREFLQRLAQASGGQTVTADRAKELAASVNTLLLRG